MNTRKTNILAVLLGFTALSLFSGCASTSSDGGETSLTKEDVIVAAEIAAGLAIGDDYDLALQYVRDAREFLNSGQSTTVDAVVDHLLNRALHNKLEPGQAIAVKRFIDRFRGHFALEVEQVGIDPNILVTVNEVLDAVERVAREIERYGAAQPRTYAAAQAPLRQDPVDFSLWGYLTKPETRQWCRAYYADDLAPPQAATDRQKLNSLRLATGQSLEFEPVYDASEPSRYRVDYSLAPAAVDGRAWMLYASE